MPYFIRSSFIANVTFLSVGLVEEIPVTGGRRSKPGETLEGWARSILSCGQSAEEPDGSQRVMAVWASHELLSVRQDIFIGLSDHPFLRWRSFS